MVLFSLGLHMKCALEASSAHSGNAMMMNELLGDEGLWCNETHRTRRPESSRADRWSIWTRTTTLTLSISITHTLSVDTILTRRQPSLNWKIEAQGNTRLGTENSRPMCANQRVWCLQYTNKRERKRKRGFGRGHAQCNHGTTTPMSQRFINLDRGIHWQDISYDHSQLWNMRCNK